MSVIFITILLVCAIAELKCVKYSSLDKTYNRGVQAYSRERWSECIVQFEESLHLYKVYKSILINCRLKCKSENHKQLITENFDDLKIFESFFIKRDCLTKCQNDEFETANLFHNASESILTNMQLKKPYEYLQLCYFQMNALPKAASAAFTYLAANPTHEGMKRNVEYYIQQPEVDIKEVKNLESMDYEILYKLGLTAYKLNKWEETVDNLEESLTDFFAWENSCRVECDNQPEQEWSSEFTISIAYNMASLLTCRQNCQNKLRPQYKSGIEFIADVLNYLQISYYHLDKMDKAARSVASYLLLLPYDEDMLENEIIYKTLIDEKEFIERSDIIFYYKRDNYEKQLLDLFHKEGNDIEDNIVQQKSNI